MQISGRVRSTRVYWVFRDVFCSWRVLMRVSCSVQVDVLVEERKEGEEKGTLFVHGFWYGVGI